jgi:hypothetical protein
LLGSKFLVSNNCTEREEQCFLCGPCRDFIIGTVWSNELQVYSFESQAVGREPPFWGYLSTEAQE